jgi:hypothetical protein
MNRSLRAVTLGAACTVLLLMSVAVRAGEPEREPVPPASTDQFDIRNVEGWAVYIKKQDLVDHADAMAEALDHMQNQLYQVRLTVPPPAVAITQERVPIWLEYDNEPAASGFHPDYNWLLRRGYASPEGLTSMVGMCRLKGFCRTALHQPWVMLHELAHGYDYLYLGRGRQYSNARIEAAFDRAEKSGTYESVLCRYSPDTKHYAITNKMEYFAENSEAYFGTNDFYPFVRAELKEHDPDMYLLLQDLWGVDAEEQQRVTESLARFIESQEAAADIPDDQAGYTPTAEYEKRQVEGWTVYVSEPLVRKKAYGDEVCKLVGHKLHLVKRYMPEKATEQLRQVPIWLEEDSRCVPYVAYHGSAEALEKNGLNPDKLHAVEIGSSENFRRWQSLQPFVLMNQLARAYYDQVLGENAAKVTTAWEKAVEGDEYDSVLRFDGRHVRHPALASPQDFFAEMTESYYGVNDHYPFLQFEAIQHDPETCRLLAELWGGEAK